MNLVQKLITATKLILKHSKRLTHNLLGENIIKTYKGGYFNFTQGSIEPDNINLHKYIIIPSEKGEKYLYSSDRENYLYFLDSDENIIDRIEIYKGLNRVTIPDNEGIKYIGIQIEFSPGGVLENKQGNWENVSLRLDNNFNRSALLFQSLTYDAGNLYKYPEKYAEDRLIDTAGNITTAPDWILFGIFEVFEEEWYSFYDTSGGV